MSETILILRIERDVIKKRNTMDFMKSARFSCPTLSKLKVSLQILEKYSNI